MFPYVEQIENDGLNHSLPYGLKTWTYYPVTLERTLHPSAADKIASLISRMWCEDYQTLHPNSRAINYVPYFGDLIRDVGEELVTNEGKILKRICAYLHDLYSIDDESWKLSKEQRNRLGQHINRLTGTDIKASIVFAPGASWTPGMFKEKEDSCWWGMYRHAISTLYMNGGGAILLYDENREPVGRAWYMPILDTLAIFNGYGYQTRSISMAVGTLVKSKDILEISVDFGESVYVNNDKAYVLKKLPVTGITVSTKVSNLPLFSPHKCADCNERLWSKDICTRGQLVYCEPCYYKHTITDLMGRQFWDDDGIQIAIRNMEDTFYVVVSPTTSQYLENNVP